MYDSNLKPDIVEQYINGTTLRAIRQKAGLTTVKMAELAGAKTRQTYENWEKNKSVPTINQFIAMCLGCDSNPLLHITLALHKQGEF